MIETPFQQQFDPLTATRNRAAIFTALKGRIGKTSGQGPPQLSQLLEALE